MKNVTVTVSGCDDSTSVDMRITDAEFRFLDKVADAISEASEAYCQPTMSVWVPE